MIHATRVPTLTTAQMQDVERLMVRVYKIGLLQMMEQAGRSLAVVARRMLEGEVADRPIVVLAGRGNNGGGGLVAARTLLNWGAWVQIICAHPPEAHRGATGQQLATLQAMGAALSWAEEGWELPPADLLIDAVIGYGLRGDPRGKARNLTQLANSSRAQILSLDVPSGIDTEQGRAYDPHVQATATVALALPKRGLLQPEASNASGTIYLADLGVPAGLYAQLGIEVAPSLFARNDLPALHVVNGEFYVDE